MDYNSLSDIQLIELVAQDTTYLKCVSERTREYCMRFMRRMSDALDPELMKDVYHDALIVLYEKARSGEFTLTCSLQTYLNSVCRNQLLNQARKQAKTLPLPGALSNDTADANEQYSDAVTDWLHSDDDGIDNERVQAIMQALEHMKGKGDCHELLLLVHYSGRSMKEVAAHFGYKSEQIARNKNYLCREQLKTLALGILKRLRK